MRGRCARGAREVRGRSCGGCLGSTRESCRSVYPCPTRRMLPATPARRCALLAAADYIRLHRVAHHPGRKPTLCRPTLLYCIVAHPSGLQVYYM